MSIRNGIVLRSLTWEEKSARAQALALFDAREALDKQAMTLKKARAAADRALHIAKQSLGLEPSPAPIERAVVSVLTVKVVRVSPKVLYQFKNLMPLQRMYDKFEYSYFDKAEISKVSGLPVAYYTAEFREPATGRRVRRTIRYRWEDGRMIVDHLFPARFA